MTSTVETTARYRAAAVAVAPVLLVAASLWHPYLAGRLPNDEVVAEAVAAGPTRWGLAHLAAGVAFGFVVLAFVAIHAHLRQTGGTQWSARGLPFVVVGSTLYTLLPGMEFAPLAAVESGADAEAAQAELTPWFVPVLVTGGVAFLVGVLCFVAGIVRSGLLDRRLAGLVIAGLLVMAVSRLVPLAAVQLYVQGLAALVALWPLAFRIWRQPGYPAPASTSTLAG
jgi:hypothetical protein